MKKRYLLGLTVGMLLVTGCSGGTSGEDYSSYEYHIYDETFKHTEDLVAKYDSTGKLVLFESYMIYDKRTDSNPCREFNSNIEDIVDLDYPGVTAKCTVDENGVKMYYSMTDKSVAKGYLKDDKDFKLPLKRTYEDIADEKMAKETFQKLLDRVREEEMVFDERNYIIIDDVKIEN